jgi:Mg/Co/Ni transporter MgtE
MPVGSYCQQPVCTIDGKETAQAAAERMDKEGVVDKKGRLVGVIAVDDLLRLVVGELGGLAKAVRSQSQTRG